MIERWELPFSFITHGISLYKSRAMNDADGFPERLTGLGLGRQRGHVWLSLVLFSQILPADLHLTSQLGPRPEDQGESGHQEALSTLPVADPRQAGLQGTQAAAAHTARERKNNPLTPTRLVTSWRGSTPRSTRNRRFTVRPEVKTLE